MKTIFLADFISFLKNPKSYLVSLSNSNKNKNAELSLNDHDNFANDSIWSKFWLFIRTLSFAFVVAIILGIAGSILASLVDYSQTDNNRLFEVYGEYSVFFVLLLISVIGPFLEELSYRLLLSNKKTWFLLGSFFFICFNLQIVVSLISDEGLSLLAFLGGIFVSFLFTLIAFFLISKEKIERFVNIYFNYIFYTVSLVFGLVHLSNYNNLQEILLLMPLLVLPQLFVTFIFGYTRVKFNSFWWVFAMHACYNFITSFSLLVYSIGLNKFKLNELNQILEQEDPGQLQKLIESLDSFTQLKLVVLNILMFSLYLGVFGLFVFVLIEYFIYLGKSKKDKNLETQEKLILND